MKILSRLLLYLFKGWMHFLLNIDYTRLKAFKGFPFAIKNVIVKHYFHTAQIQRVSIALLSIVPLDVLLATTVFQKQS